MDAIPVHPGETANAPSVLRSEGFFLLPLPPPNHTQTPNVFFDESLPKIKSFAELKVILAVVRQTFGWHKDDDQLSISRLRGLTGLTRQSVVAGVALALEHEFLEREPQGQSFKYKLKVVKEVDYLEPQASQVDRLELVKKVDQKVVKEVDTQKKGDKEKKETSAYALLFKRHYDRVTGDVQKPQAQGKAIREILNLCSPEKALACYESQLSEPWRKGHVDWLTVRMRISEFSANGNGHKPRDSAFHAKQAELARKLGREYRPDAE